MGELIQLEAGRKVRGWTIEKKLGEGAFGAVYKCYNDKHEFYALKVESKEEKIQLLKMEVFVLTELAKVGGRHFCKIEDKGQSDKDKFNYVVMTFVGMSLADLKANAPNKRFSYGTAISVGIQSLEALEDLHGIGYLHRDVKPGNYTIGRPELNELRKIYVLDFGMARKFVHNDGTIKHPRAVANFRGTIKYAPVSCHAGRELCRQDDCESWLYMLVELTKGSLPWKNLQDIQQVGSEKRAVRTTGETGIKRMFGGCPREYIDVLRCIDSGQFFEEPDYGKMYALLRKALVSTGAKEYPYDWEDYLMERMKKEQKGDKKEEITTAPNKNPEKKSDEDENGEVQEPKKKLSELELKTKSSNTDAKKGSDVEAKKKSE